ncbi:hypothetical protein [Actinomadura rupiterrae]|uniref:hypothetical protein n=1 Tax=Actinomadura rupiterrae TaxID=559627 RepID=UPI0020A3CA2B|nr:hypothetical protein [Actinomadura rupiterrae]MCP2339695.1 hypothetical protein [Actinomadura rupiterrae]
MIALIRFQLAGYLRSMRFLPPLIVAVLLVLLVFGQWPSGPDRIKLATGTLGDAAAFMVPLSAWTSRSLLDTQPTVQRWITLLAVRQSAIAGLLAAFTASTVLGLILFAAPLLQALTIGVPAATTAAAALLVPLACAAGTLIGAWTSRAIIPGAGASLLTLLAILTASLLLGLGRLSFLAIPYLDWIKAAHNGPSNLQSSLPAVLLHLFLWCAAAATGYLLTLHRQTTPT